MSLLIVEDEERVASFLDKGLRAHGYTVEWVQTGQDALRRLMHPGISLVILDLGLPDLDGLDVLECLRGRGFAVPVPSESIAPQRSGSAASWPLGSAPERHRRGGRQHPRGVAGPRRESPSLGW